MNLNVFQHSTGTGCPRHLIFNIVNTGVKHYHNNKVLSLDRPGHILKNIPIDLNNMDFSLFIYYRFIPCLNSISNQNTFNSLTK